MVTVKSMGATVLDLPLTEGAVLTGCVVHESKQPVVGREVLYEEIDSAQGFSAMHFRPPVLTDDRGCFRIYALPDGQFRVGIGKAPELTKNLPLAFASTFYPGVQSRSEATSIQLTAGQERDLGRLVLKGALNTFSVKGVFTDGAQQLPNYIFELVRYDGNNISGTSQRTTDERGQFRLDDLLEGTYSIQPVVKPQLNVEYTFRLVSFEVTNRNIDDIVITCTSLTARIKGDVVINDILPATDSDCTVALKEGEGFDAANGRIHRVKLEGGKFSLTGLNRGVYTLIVMPLKPSLQYQEAQVGRETIKTGGVYGIVRIDVSAGEEAIRIFLRVR